MLRARFASVAKAMKPALRELATRTERRLRRNGDGDPVVQALVEELERNLVAEKVKLERETAMRVDARTRVYGGEVAVIETAYRHRVKDVRA